MRISDWSSDVCSSDLASMPNPQRLSIQAISSRLSEMALRVTRRLTCIAASPPPATIVIKSRINVAPSVGAGRSPPSMQGAHQRGRRTAQSAAPTRSEEHTSELQSLMRNSYAVFCLKKKKTKHKIPQQNQK